jgi:AraC-like DNA-binding protein
LIFIYDHTDYRLFLEALSTQLGCEFDGQTMYFPKHLADGYLRLVEMPGGLQAILSNYVSKSDMEFKRVASLPEVFTFRVDYVDLSEGSHLEIDDTDFIPSASVYASMLVTSSRFNFKLVINKGTRIRSINLFLKRDWVEKYFPAQNTFNWVNNVHALRLSGVNRVPIDFEARASLFSLIGLPIIDPRYLFTAQARIFELADFYYKHIIRQQNLLTKKEVLRIDVSKIIELDVIFTRDIENGGTVPSIDEMAEAANMSSSKLKTLFKQIYSQTINDYFNACRLNACRKMLLETDANIKEVSAKFSFKSVQHFTTAFKKEFGNTPAYFIKNEIA